MAELVTFKPSIPAKPEIFYPETDGEPMGETEFHVTAILDLFQSLRHFFRNNLDVYVAADMLFYFEEGNPSAFKVPDVFVVKGIPKTTRRIYKLWQEGKAPCAVFEITSQSTWLEDMGNKRALYEKLGVPEYFLFDPEDGYLSPRLQGFQLVDNFYRPVPLSAEGTLFSAELGLILKPEGMYLRVIDPVSGALVPNLAEASQQAVQAEKLAQAEAERANAETVRAQAEAERADQAEAEAARLRAELERLKRQSGSEG